MSDNATTRAELLARRHSLALQLEAMTAPPESGAGISFGKRVGDGTTEAVERISSTLTARSTAASIAEIDTALERIDAGTYGVCASCGTEIPRERLEARPSSLMCVACAGKHPSGDSV